jgi:hypothetical protein
LRRRTREWLVVFHHNNSNKHCIFGTPTSFTHASVLFLYSPRLPIG